MESVIQLRNALGVQKIRFGMTMNNPVSIHRETYNQESSIFKSKLSEFNSEYSNLDTAYYKVFLIKIFFCIIFKVYFIRKMCSRKFYNLKNG